MSAVYVFFNLILSVDCMMSWARPLNCFWLWFFVEVGIFIAVTLLSDETSWDSKWYEGVSLYFIVQVAGSFIILASFYLSHELLDSDFNWISSAILCYSGLSLKLGLFPFHFWVRRSFSKFSYVGIFIAGSMCNANLVYAGSAIDYELWCYFFYVSSLIGMLYASVMVIFSVEVNVLLSYASVGFTSLLTLCSVIDCIHLIFVFSILYCVSMLMLTFVLSNSNCHYVNDLWADIPAKYKPVLFLSAFSFSGSPLSLNFCVNIAVVYEFSGVLLNNDSLVILLVLFLSSVGNFMVWALVSFYAFPVSFYSFFTEFWTRNTFLLLLALFEIFPGACCGTFV